ncbi:tetratricopeptide repeat protein [Deltaproteobacteria bacterium TL4]
MFVNKILLCFLFGTLVFSKVQSQTIWTEGLTEQQQIEFMDRLVEDELYSSAYQVASSYLLSFPQGQYRENASYSQAHALKQANLNSKQALSLHQSFLEQYPHSSKKARVSLDIGALLAQLQNYQEALKQLQQFLTDFPQSTLRDEARYWLGYASFYHAEEIRSQQTLEKAQFFYQQVLNYLLEFQAAPLLHKDQLERLYILGWSFHYQKKWDQAQQWLLQYAQQSDHQERNAFIYYQIGLNQRELQQFSQSKLFFDILLNSYPDSSLYASAIFWKAEMSYAESLQQRQNPSHALDASSDAIPSESETPSDNIRLELIHLYQNYLETNETTYKPTTFFRLGVLFEQQQELQKALAFYEKYHSSKDTVYLGEVLSHMAQIQIKNNKPKLAAETLEAALRTTNYAGSFSSIQKLLDLYQQTQQTDRIKALLIDAKTNATLQEDHRLYFKTELIQFYFKQQDCDSIFKELTPLPQNLSPEKLNYFSYIQGSCYLRKEKWVEAKSKLSALTNVPEYQKVVFRPLQIVYQQLKEWSALISWMEKFSQLPEFVLSSEDYRLWIFALHQNQNWPHIVTLYQQWEVKYPQDVNTAQNLMNWAQVYQILNQSAPSQLLYEKALAQLKETDTELREPLVLRLADLYLKEKAFQKVTKIYEKHLIPFLQNKPKQQQYAFYLGQVYYHSLQNVESSRLWLKKVDQGGTEEIEINALLFLSQVESNSQNFEQAIQILSELILRKPSEQRWFVPIHFQLAMIHLQKKEWDLAVTSLQAVVAFKTKSEEQQKLQLEATQRIQEIKQFRIQQKLNTLVSAKAWKELSAFINENLKTRVLQSDPQVIDLLVLAESQQKNWQAVLNAYTLLSPKNLTHAKTPQSLAMQAQAYEQLKDLQRAESLYLQALANLSPEDLDSRVFFIEKLGILYTLENKLTEKVKIYEENYPRLKPQHQQHFAYVIGSTLVQLLPPEAYKKVTPQQDARNWLIKADQGGTSDEELEAIFLLANLDSKANQISRASQMLENLAKRNIPQKSPWYLLIHFHLGRLYHYQEKLQLAQKEYDLVAKTAPPPEFQKEHQTAIQLSKEIGVYLQSLNAK